MQDKSDQPLSTEVYKAACYEDVCSILVLHSLVKVVVNKIF